MMTVQKIRAVCLLISAGALMSYLTALGSTIDEYGLPRFEVGETLEHPSGTSTLVFGESLFPTRNGKILVNPRIYIFDYSIKPRGKDVSVEDSILTIVINFEKQESKHSFLSIETLVLTDGAVAKLRKGQLVLADLQKLEEQISTEIREVLENQFNPEHQRSEPIQFFWSHDMRLDFSKLLEQEKTDKF